MPGSMVPALLAERMGASFGGTESRKEVAEGSLAGVPVPLAARSYMNLSGGPAAALGGFYKIPRAGSPCPR